jgi:hypothetical protein
MEEVLVCQHAIKREWECPMRKLLLAVATVGLLAAGSSEPAQARVFIGFGNGPGFYGYHRRPNFYNCSYKQVKVRVWSNRLHKFVWRWRTKRFCW